MLEQERQEAFFHGVDESGNIIVIIGNDEYFIEYTDALAKAVDQARSINTRHDTPPVQHARLPLSQIQQLIRAGVDPQRVAERFSISLAQVQRFAGSVQTEKQYAIEQFLAITAPRASRARTVAELIERTLASAGIGMESVAWRATRRGIEPWRIEASLSAAGQIITAVWAWNIHTNTIESCNGTARKLLGEDSVDSVNRHDSAPIEAKASLSFGFAIPGDSVQSARIERSVAQLTGHEQEERPTLDTGVSRASTHGHDHGQGGDPHHHQQYDPTQATTQHHHQSAQGYQSNTHGFAQAPQQAERDFVFEQDAHQTQLTDQRTNSDNPNGQYNSPSTSNVDAGSSQSFTAEQTMNTFENATDRPCDEAYRGEKATEDLSNALSNTDNSSNGESAEHNDGCTNGSDNNSSTHSVSPIGVDDQNVDTQHSAQRNDVSGQEQGSDANQERRDSHSKQSQRRPAMPSWTQILFGD